ncbi:FtsK/SpoIIIE domain-containing protein [Amycolatopsis sp. H20-H5]|uniref:FtsK/SpoIIIE domain-containing protein n=1 Tax=Amycolatopsis sp. H20-H5 TaxID=3046309 RepID=UPI002DB6F4C0|nr:FtsK/SpoIIIE domain-containing protein [Amycolatopsis sp. H20-H5]MEC3977166.1 FtsK/SpoIIIE domain-containing protein [Amycolatopsis sp. H20-H5]
MSVAESLSHLDAAAQRVAATTADALGVLAEDLSDRGRAARVADVEAQFARDTAIVHMRVGVAVDQRLRHLHGVVADLGRGARAVPWPESAPLPVEEDALAVAQYVRVGAADLGQFKFDASHTDALPVMIPLLNRANIVVKASGWNSEMANLVQALVARALCASGPGQLMLRVFDPALRSYLSLFSALREVDEALFPRPGAHGEDLEELLRTLTDDVRRVGDLGHGQEGSLGELRQSTGQPIEAYQLVVLLDYPRGVSEHAAQMLEHLLRVGPARGVSFVIHHGAELAHNKSAMAALRNVENSLMFDGTDWVWSAVNGLTIRVDRPSSGSLQATADLVAAAARRCSAPMIAFTQIQPPLEAWTARSGDGISAAIGLSGHKVMTVTLGDEREQRHNMLITGAVGQGKSNLLMVLIHSFASRYSPSELEL